MNPLSPTVFRQELVVPRCPDKSITHRAVMFASMARGRSQIFNPLDSADCLATRMAFEKLGVRFTESHNAQGELIWTVDSDGASAWRSPLGPVDLGNSGTSARLLLGLFAGVPGLSVTITGDQSLKRRPMGRVVEPLRAMGAMIEATDSANDADRLPLTITGKQLVARNQYVRAPSAQVKSSLLMAGLSAAGETVIDLPAGTRNHTEKMLEALGASFHAKTYLGREKVQVTGPWRPEPFTCRIPSDPSSVAFFAALAALHPGLKVRSDGVLVNATRTGLFKILEFMGVQVLWELDAEDACALGERTGSVSFYRPPGRELRPADVGEDDVKTLIDEIPILAVVCALADGVSRIRGLSELRIKESDRLTSTADLLGRAGIKCQVDGQNLEISGGAGIRAFSFGSDDHRLVMSAMILATRGEKPSDIRGLNWISTSFPLFLESFRHINLGIQNT